MHEGSIGDHVRKPGPAGLDLFGCHPSRGARTAHDDLRSGRMPRRHHEHDRHSDRDHDRGEHQARRPMLAHSLPTSAKNQRLDLWYPNDLVAKGTHGLTSSTIHVHRLVLIESKS